MLCPRPFNFRLLTDLFLSLPLYTLVGILIPLKSWDVRTLFLNVLLFLFGAFLLVFRLLYLTFVQIIGELGGLIFNGRFCPCILLLCSRLHDRFCLLLCFRLNNRLRFLLLFLFRILSQHTKVCNVFDTQRPHLGAFLF